MRILILNQCFYPDVVAVAQHLTEFAVEVKRRGHEVTVVASQRGYDDPGVEFPKREIWNGIRIIRLPTTALGKRAKWRRAVDFGSFIFSAAVRLLLLPRYDVVVALTAPPLISFLATVFVQLKGGRLLYWIMDLNPDEAIAAGWLRPGSAGARTFAAMLHHSLKRADKIVVLDRFMKRRIVGKGIAENKIEVVPPWSHDDAVRFDAGGRREFRRAYGLTDKFVVMYSGNHSPCHPLDTMLEAARRLAGRDRRLAFCFVGGGSEFKKVQSFAHEHELKNIVCLPYQPLERLAASLSAADMHVVVMGDEFAGIVHPCKIYNILAVGAPFLYVGPEESHVVDILSQLDGGGHRARRARHGDVDSVIDHILGTARGGAPTRTAEDGRRFAARFSKHALLPKMIGVLESMTFEASARRTDTPRSSARTV
ncbi:MAG: glycosyltransferase family 4 protein [Acidobacteriota bacterium]|nr:glycosyltransferase family 4 protein [Acidobacteriota bacterium]